MLFVTTALLLRALSVSLFILAASVAATDLQAQTVWNNYSGSSGVPITFDRPAGTNQVPLISAAIGGATSSTPYMFDTGSTGIQVFSGQRL